MKDICLKAARYFDRGATFWDVLPLLKKLPRKVIVLHDFQNNIVVEWGDPDPELDDRYRAEMIRPMFIKNKDKLLAEQKEVCDLIAFHLKEWAEWPTEIPKKEFRKNVQEVADYIDQREGSQKELARAFYKTLSPKRKGEKARDAGGEAQAIEAITKQIQYIERARRKKS